MVFMVDEDKFKVTDEFERTQLEHKFPRECEQIPLDDLRFEEKIVVLKCIDHQELDDNEFKLLKKVLVRYRKAINQIKPKETIEAVQDFNNIIRNEKELIRLLKQDKILRVNIPINGTIYPVTFTILPINDSSAIESLQFHMDLFKDWSSEERRIMQKSQLHPESLNDKEAKILEALNKRLEDSALSNYEETVLNLLSNQLIIQGSDSTIEERRELWELMPFQVKYAIFMKVQDILGLSDMRNEELFPAQ